MSGDLAVGDRLDVELVPGRSTGFGRRSGIGPHGTVEQIGGCGHPTCRWGDECVTVRWDGAPTTVNMSAVDALAGRVAS